MYQRGERTLPMGSSYSYLSGRKIRFRSNALRKGKHKRMLHNIDQIHIKHALYKQESYTNEAIH